MKKKLYVLAAATLAFLSTFSQNISNALDFDGIDDYVGVPNGTALIANLSAFSMCAWVYPTNPNANWPDFDGYFGIKNEGVCDFYLAQINGTGLEARIRTNVNIYTISPSELSQVNINEWHHFALVYTGSELQLYLNGVLDGSVPAEGTITFNNFELTFGKLVYGFDDFYFDGKLDEITIWSKALTESEVQEYQCIGGDPSAIADLTAYYNFNEEEGLILPDYFGNNNGSLSGMTGNEWITSEICEPGFKITFTVTDEETLLPVENATVNLEGIIKTTDEFGVAEFTNYDPGLYPWSVNKSNYYESLGMAEIIDEDIAVDIILSPILHYSITFIVTENLGVNPVEDALVNLDGLIQYTNELGVTTFTNYLPGSYPYTIIKEGYPLVIGTADVIDDDLTIEVDLLIDNIGEFESKGIFIYPNPTESLLNINLDDNFPAIEQIILFDLTGKIISHWGVSNHKNQIDLSGFKKGVYLIQIKAGEDVIKSPVMVK